MYPLKPYPRLIITLFSLIDDTKDRDGIRSGIVQFFSWRKKIMSMNKQ